MENKDKTPAAVRESETSFTHRWENTYDIIDIFKDIVALVIISGFAFGWMMLMLLIISFVTVSYLHFNIKVMFIVSILTGAAAGIAYTVKTVRKYRGMTWKNKQ